MTSMAAPLRTLNHNIFMSSPARGFSVLTSPTPCFLILSGLLGVDYYTLVEIPWTHSCLIFTSLQASSRSLQKPEKFITSCLISRIVLRIFVKGARYLYGPFFDHTVAYWKMSLEQPDKVLFLKYEDFKDDPGQQLKRVAVFVGMSFAPEGRCRKSNRRAIRVLREREEKLGLITAPLLSISAAHCRRRISIHHQRMFRYLGLNILPLSTGPANHPEKPFMKIDN